MFNLKLWSTVLDLSSSLPPPMEPIEPMCLGSLPLLFGAVVNGWWRSGLALHSRPVFRDGFLLAYTMWCCTILPSRFQFKFEKMKPQWTSKRSVPTLSGEGINTHTKEGRNTSLVPPELKNKHRVRSFFSAKESIFRVKNLKFSFMGASPFSKTLIIRQISHYLPD